MADGAFDGPAVAMLDIGDIPRGLLALDHLAKEAFVDVIARGTVQPGRYLILFGGDVEAVQRSMNKAMAAANESVLDSVLLPYAEERIVPAILATSVRWPAPGDTLGVVSNGSSPTLLATVDAALKGALVELLQLRVAEGLGGRAIAMLWGETHDVEAAIEIATDVAAGSAQFSTAVIRNADPEVATALQSNNRFFQEWRG